MCRVPVQLRELVKQRLEAAAEEIFELLEKTITEYEEHLVSTYEQKLQGALYTPAPELTLELTPELTPEVPHIVAVQTLSAEGQVSEEPPELERIQIINSFSARGPVKEEQLLVSIAQTLVKEEPAAAVIDAPLPCDWVKEELPESKALTLLFIKQEPTEQSITPPLIPQDQDFNPNQFQEQNVDQDLTPAQNQHQDLPQHFEEEEDNVEWEFEGLSPPRPSPDQTENSSEEEEAFPPDHPPKLLRVRVSPMVNPAQKSGDSDKRANALATNDVTTEDSSDPSDSERTTAKTPRIYLEKVVGKHLSESTAQPKDLRIISNNVIKTFNIVERAEEDKADKAGARTKPKRKRSSRKKSDKTPKESSSKSSQACAVCKRTFDSQKKLTSHMKAHNESLPCRVCGKLFKQEGFLVKHMRTHQSETHRSETHRSETHRSETPKRDAVERTGEKQRAKSVGGSVLSKKRKRDEKADDTDPDHTEDSSDDS